MRDFGKLKTFTKEGQDICLEFENGTGKICILTDTIVRIQDITENEPVSSKAVEQGKARDTKVYAEQESGEMCIRTEKLLIRVEDNFKIGFYDCDGQVLCRDYKGERKALKEIDPEMLEFMAKEGHQFQGDGQEHKVQIVKKMEGEEFFYGLGDKTGFLNKRGYEYTMWNTDNPAPHVDSFQSLYKSIPFFITLRDNVTFGLFFDNTNRSYFDMGKESSDYYWFGADMGSLDYYFISGRDMKEVLSGYTFLTGTAPLPQLWTLGYHQSRWGYKTEKDIRNIAEKMKENDIPCDAIHMDIDYMDQYKVFTVNSERFPDLKRLTEDLSDYGIKAVTIIDPGVKKENGYSVYETGVKERYFATAKTGEIYENVVWPGAAVYPDFGREEVRSWWGENHRVLIENGVRGIWNDMNEPASFAGELPDDVVFYDGERKSDHAEIHNVYGHYMSKGTYEGLKKIEGKRPFVITRACYAGTQKYAIAWTGDNHSIWAHLQMAVTQICNLGLSGMPIVGSDIGGFGSDTTKELLCRWIQVGCFSPFCRNHSAMGTRNQEPWQFDKETTDIYRKYVKLRYKLVPYYYDLFYGEEKNGIPVMRPLVLNYPNDSKTRECNGEFMIGDHILVAPVMEQGARQKLVYLPEENWYDYWTGEKKEGGQYFVREADLDLCPVYVKEGSIIPGLKECSSLDKREKETLILDVYAGSGEYVHYQDDGESFAYREGGFNKYRFCVEGNQVSGKIEHLGYENLYQKFIISFHDGKETKMTEYEVSGDEKDSSAVEGVLFHIKF